MHAKSTVAAALLSASTLVSAGSAVVNNNCNFPVFLTSVNNIAGETQKLDTNEQWSHAYETNPDGGGVSIKIAMEPSLYTGAAITQLEYTIDSTLWYDMSNINGNPFMQYGMSLKSSSSACRDVHCAAGVEECDEAYNNPDENENTAACTPDADLVLDLCGEKNNVINKVGQAVGGALDVATGNNHKHKHHHNHSDHKKHHHHHNKSDDKKHHNKHHNKHHKQHKEPAPAPVPAPAPSAPAVPAPAAAAVTTFLTQVVTVTARDAKPTADAHAHANYHRHHFHRHS